MFYQIVASNMTLREGPPAI